MPVKTKSAKTKQKFVRINIDPKLEHYLSLYEEKYPLFSRSDVVRMLLSQSIKMDLESIELLSEEQSQGIYTSLKQIKRGLAKKI